MSMKWQGRPSCCQQHMENQDGILRAEQYLAVLEASRCQWRRILSAKAGHLLDKAYGKAHHRSLRPIHWRVQGHCLCPVLPDGAETLRWRMLHAQAQLRPASKVLA